MITSGYQNVGMFKHIISKEGENSKFSEIRILKSF